MERNFNFNFFPIIVFNLLTSIMFVNYSFHFGVDLNLTIALLLAATNFAKIKMHYNKDFTGIFNIKLKEGSNE